MLYRLFTCRVGVGVSNVAQQGAEATLSCRVAGLLAVLPAMTRAAPGPAGRSVGVIVSGQRDGTLGEIDDDAPRIAVLRGWHFGATALNIRTAAGGVTVSQMFL